MLVPTMSRYWAIAAAFVIAVSVLTFDADAWSQESTLGIPLKPDPPLAVDGELGDWVNVSAAQTVDRPEQVVWGAGTWTSKSDLSGTVRLAWRDEHLYLAVDVVDDTIRQSERGANLWKGDHIELYLDALPDSEPDRDVFGDGQYHFAFSPGSFTTTGDPLLDTTPEAHCYLPVNGPIDGIQVAAARTPSGYTLEAAIPWKLLGHDRGVLSMPLRIEVGLSDTDSREPQQESMMTLSSAKWGHTRSRLLNASLAGTDGAVTMPDTGTVVADKVDIVPGQRVPISFDAPATPEGRNPVLVFDARLDYPTVAGYAPSLRVTLDGQTLDGGRLLNKPLRVKSRGGQVYSMSAGDLLSVFYSPDYYAPDAHPHYGLLDGVRACRFELDLTGAIREGVNELVFEHAAGRGVENAIILEHARLEFRLPSPSRKERQAAPTGPLDTFEPQIEHRIEYSLETAGPAAFNLSLAGEQFRIASRFSTPAPEWTTQTNTYFKHERKIEELPEAIVIRDTFTNLTTDNLPLMHRHELDTKDGAHTLWLAGLEQARPIGSSALPSNPTTYVAGQSGGIGLLPLDDVFRVHVANYGVDGSAGIADNTLVLRPGVTYTAEWVVIPTAAGSYWSFINAARRQVGANFTIPGGFAFLRADPSTEVWSDSQLADFIRYKDAYYTCASINYPLYEGTYTHGTAFQFVPHDNYVAAVDRRRRVAPESKTLVYFHCFLDVHNDAPALFADARTLRPDGLQADYGDPRHKIFLPTRDNAFGREVKKNVDVIFDEIGADGVYWDEHEYSRWRYHYGDPWDGVSGDIDPQSMRISGLKSSVTLLSEPWRVELAKHILSRGPLVGNDVPYTRAMAALKFPCFVETGSITNCTQAHLYSPIALGDHLTERSEQDAYQTMLEALNYGCVYHWYNDMDVIPTHHHLTRYMFPITPLEIHEGYIIGNERIITNRSGLFGWGDASQHEVHVFDETGRELETFEAPKVTIGEKNYSELRLAEGMSAAIVRSVQEAQTP